MIGNKPNDAVSAVSVQVAAKPSGSWLKENSEPPPPPRAKSLYTNPEKLFVHRGT